MDDKVIALIKDDISRCEQQTVNEGSYKLYQALIGKYNGLFPGFSADIPQSGKVSTGGAFNYRPELNAIKEKLELALITEQAKDPLFKFKEMLAEDIERLSNMLQDANTSEEEKQQLYLTVTSRYHSYVPKLGEGLYSYVAEQGFYEEVSGAALDHNLNGIYNKLLTFQALNYPGLGDIADKTPNTVVTITNTNDNKNTVEVTFDSVRSAVNSMTSLPEEEIEEIQKKVNEIEEIVNSKDSKSKKWSKAKEILRWTADKGVDVGIELLPLILKIG